MIRQRTLLSFLVIAVITMISVNALAATDDSPWAPLIDIAFEQNDLEMAVLILVNDNNIPVSDIILKTRETGYGYTRIVDSLIDTKLSCEQVMIEALKNDVPAAALFDSEKIIDDYDYTPELILQFLVQELSFMELTEEHLGERDENKEAKKQNLEIIIRVCKTMIDDEDYSPYDVIFNLCQAEASNKVISETADRLDVPQATTFKACPEHAQYGHAYISHELPQEAYIIIGVDHKTLDDNAGRGVISPIRP